MTDTTVVIKGRNELGLAVKQAEQQMKGLLKQGELVAKFFRGGAVLAAVYAFERLAEGAEKAADAVGDKGTAQALKQLNAEIDRLKQKGTNIIGQVLGQTFIAVRGTEIQKLTQDITNLRGEVERLLQSNGGTAQGLGPGYDAKVQQLRDLEARLKQATQLEATFTSRRLAAVSRGGGSGILTRYSSEFDADKPKATKAGGYVPSAEMEAYTAHLERMGEANAHFQETLADADEAIRDQFAESVEIGTEQLEHMASTAEQTTDSLSVFAEQAGRNMQSVFADFLFDPFAEGLNGMLAGFTRTIQRMVAEAAAAEILTMFFSWAGGAIGGKTGAFISSMGARASGGPVMAGMPYTVGERGKETFVPSTNGTILPNGVGGGVSLSYTIDARGADAERIMAIMPGLLKQSSDQTVARVRDLVGRGKLV
jgi:hypothetical protein